VRKSDHSGLVWFDLEADWSEDELEPWLSAADRTRYERLLSPIHQRRQRSACALLKGCLSRLGPCPTDLPLGLKGKPYWPDGPHFNLSHSGRYAALAWQYQDEVGLDLEDTHREVDFSELGQRFFARSEAALLRQSSHPRRLFFEIWTAKEAYIKAIGSGLHHPLDQFVTIQDTQLGLWDLQGQALEWKLWRPRGPWSWVESAWCSRLEPPQVVYLASPGGHFQVLQ
jgi:4'-phosphopantetheinyl transferase